MFVQPPFWTCPACTREEAFGVLMITGRQYTRRCTECRHTKTFPLPPVNKQLVYLDQFVLSNILKAIDPDTPASTKERLDRFYADAFTKLYRLCELQLLVCPASPLHRTESTLFVGFENLKRLHRALSHGIHLPDSDTIRHAQIICVAKRHLNLDPAADVTRDLVVRGNPDEWENSMQISLDAPALPGYETALQRVKGRKYHGYQHMYWHWQTGEGKAFADWYLEHRGALGIYMRERWGEIIERSVRSRQTSAELAEQDASAFLEPEMRLLSDLVLLFREADGNRDPYERIWHFLHSDELDDVPFLRISSFLFAAMARRAAGGMKLPAKAPYADIDMISAYLPFCDALFVDREMHSLLKEQPLQRDLKFGAKVFSLQSKSDFLGYLDDVKSRATKEHLQTVQEIYGEPTDQTRADWRQFFAGTV